MSANILLIILMLMKMPVEDNIIFPCRYQKILIGESTFEDVTKHFGPPNQIVKEKTYRGKSSVRIEKCKVISYHYDSLGIVFFGHSYRNCELGERKERKNTISSISFRKPFSGGTSENVKIGSHYKDVLSAYKTQDMSVLGNDSLIVVHGFTFNIKQSVVSEISIDYWGPRFFCGE